MTSAQNIIDRGYRTLSHPMTADYMCCGLCSLKFSLSEFPAFIEHKKSDCVNRYVDCSTQELHCSRCVQSFQTPWSLLCHIENDHGIKLFDNSEINGCGSSKSTSSLTTPIFFFDQTEDTLNQRISDDRLPFKDIPNQSLVQSLPLSSSEMNTEPTILRSFCPQIQTPTNISKSHSLQGVQFSSVSYQSLGTNSDALPLNLEDSIRLIHRIACSSKLEFPNMPSCDDKHVSSNASSYAVSLCCSQAGVSCTLGTCSCTCSLPISRQPTISTSCQTDCDVEQLPNPNFQHQLTLTSLPSNKTPQDFDIISSIAQPIPLFDSSNTENPVVSASPTADHPLPNQPSSKSINPAASKVIPFACSYCGMLYRQKIHLRKHIMTQHTKQKLFYCPYCPYATVERSHLTVHIRTHTGERPFTCRVCIYSSAQNCTLKSHYLRRHPESKLTCGECSRMFVTELELRNHQRNCSPLSDTEVGILHSVL